ncbi:hypothetical protein [Enterobacter mori]|uniref:hypothetical protein n=1 Tax=Enterobacter mori TaxID=539813 RepID=UPI003B83DBB4
MSERYGLSESIYGETLKAFSDDFSCIVDNLNDTGRIEFSQLLTGVIESNMSPEKIATLSETISNKYNLPVSEIAVILQIAYMMWKIEITDDS